MDRRGFLSLLGMGAMGAAAKATLDLDRLLWVPGAKTIFLPPTEIFTPIDAVFAEYCRPAIKAMFDRIDIDIARTVGRYDPHYVSRYASR